MDTSFNGSITIHDYYWYAFNRPLNGNNTVNAVNGIATFSGLGQDSATADLGSGADQLYAEGAGLTEARSNTFTIVAGAATQLVFSGTPMDTNGDGGIVANSPLTVQVLAEDAFGNVATTFNGAIALTLGSNPANAVLGGTSTQNSSGGIANFTDLTINLIGDGYTLIANPQSLGAGAANTAAKPVKRQIPSVKIMSAREAITKSPKTAHHGKLPGSGLLALPIIPRERHPFFM